MKIRKGRVTDLVELLELGEKFWKETPYFAMGRDYNKRNCGDLLFGIMLNGNGFIAVLADDEDKAVGVGFGMVAPFIFNHSYKQALELGFYIDPDHRGEWGMKLLQAMEKYAKEAGAEIMSMITMETGTAERAGHIYEKMGYSKNEVVYTKELE